MRGRRNRKSRRHPLNLQTGVLLFTPVLRATGARLHLDVPYESFPASKALGYHGCVRDLRTGKWYAVYGKECSIPGCQCDAWVDEIAPPVDCMDPSQAPF